MPRTPAHAVSRAAPVRLAVALAALVPASAGAGPLVEPSAVLNLDSAFDSNVLNARGPDEVTRIAPHLSLRLRDPDTTLTVAYDLGVWLYARGAASSTINHRVIAGLTSALTRRINLHVGDELVFAGDPGFLIRVGVVAPQTSILDNTAEGQVAFRITRRLDASAGYVYRHTTFGAPPPGSPPLHDGDEHDAALDATLRLTRSDDLRLAGRAQVFTADGSGLAVDASPALAWRHQLVPHLEWRVEGGPLFYRLLEGGRLAAAADAGVGSGLSWRAAGLVRFATRGWRASLAATRDLVGGTGAATVLWAEYVYAQAGWHDRRFDARAGVGYFANGFAPNARRLWDGVYVDLAAEVALTRWLRLGAWYSFRWQEAVEAAAGGPLPDVTRHIVGLRLGAAFGAEGRPARPPH